jgi:Ni,Fe-hydrogenase III large subunit/NADH:ubiquinone oxidoreductase subunit C
MKIGDNDWDLEPFGRHIWRGRMETGQLLALARAVREEGGQLVALWGSDERHLAPDAPPAHPAPLAPRESDGERGGFAIHVALLTSAGLAWVSCALPAESPAYPDLAHIFPQADRMQRATFDLLGIVASDAVDDRKWLRHGAWPADVFPLRKDFDPSLPATRDTDAYPFIRVEGEGVHEIPVGPIHAGTIEPGHFRFSIIGERILRLEQRLGYTHKGTEKRFEGMDLNTGAKLAGRVSGDSHIAYAWAYCMAVESASGSAVPERAAWLRALFLEIERVANHLSDLGYLGNDVALSFGFMQFWRLKEDWLRLSATLFGHRYLFDRIVPGGVVADLSDNGKTELAATAERIEAEVRSLKAIYDEHATLQDRFANTGVCKPDLAAKLGLTGLAGRASAQAWDARAQFPQAPYDQLDVSMATQRRGDVLARAEVRFAEVYESLRLIRELLKRMPAGELHASLAPISAGCEGLGWVEGWRGEVVVAVRIDADGKLDRVHPHDPSWQNWPLLEIGVLGNIVPDFPLINKSFNLSYSGADL